MKKAWLAVSCALFLSGLSCQAVFPVAEDTGISAQDAAIRLTSAVTPGLGIASNPSPTQFAPFFVLSAVQNLNLRSHPGYLAPAVQVLPDGIHLLVIGRAPGGQWFLVRTPNGYEGWVFGALLVTEEDLQAAPVLVPENAQMIHGRVLDAQGTPIRGAGFSVTRGSGVKQQGDHALTDPNGDFYLYLPVNASGVWTVSHDSIACDSNVWTGADCTVYKDGYTGKVDPVNLSITVPMADMLVFTWR